MKYFDKEGKHITLEEYMDLYLNAQYVHLFRDLDDDYLVQTTWVGHSHDFDDGRGIFETLIFFKFFNEPIDWVRYDNLEEAKKGHIETCERYLTFDQQYV